MNETMMTLVGNAATEVRFRETQAGVPVASFRLATTARRWDRGRGCWTDAHTSFYTVWAWRGLAENVAGSVSKGDPLVVRGRVRVHEWEKGGQRNTTVEIDAGVVGHDLSRGTSAFRRGVRHRSADVTGSQGGGAASGGPGVTDDGGVEAALGDLTGVADRTGGPHRVDTRDALDTLARAGRRALESAGAS